MNIQLGRELLIKRIERLEQNLKNNIDIDKSIHTLKTINYSFTRGILEGNKTKEQILVASELGHMTFKILNDYHEMIGDPLIVIEEQTIKIT